MFLFLEQFFKGYNMYFSNAIDIPLIEGGEDLLGNDIYVKALESFLLRAELPTTIAIQGKRGSGKTSLMNQLNFNLCKLTQDNGIYGRSEPYYGVWLNTWQYNVKKEPREIVLSLLQSVVKEVLHIVDLNHSHEFDTIANAFIEAYTCVAEPKPRPFLHNGVKDGHIYSLLPTENDIEDILSNPKKFKAALELAMQLCIEDDRKRNYKTNGFLIFVDDLDRLPPDITLLILQVIKNVLEVDTAAFVIAVNYEVVIKGLQEKIGLYCKENDWEFKSFFNRIVQLNFNLSTANYQLESYLEKELVRINFYSKKECRMKISGQNRPLIKGLVDVVELSIGANPRLIKTLANNLSFMLILLKNGNGKQQVSVSERLMIFGMVCAQIAYPTLYKLLRAEPEYKYWDENTAKEFGLPPLDEKTKENIAKLEEFDEEWEQIVYRICQEDEYLASRAIYISRLFNLITTITPKGQDPQVIFEKILNISSLLEIECSQIENYIDKNRMKSVKLQGPDQLLQELSMQGAEKEIILLTKEIFKKVFWFYGDFLNVTIGPKLINFRVKKNKKQTEKSFLQLYPKTDKLLVKSPALMNNEEWISIKTLEAKEDNALPEDFYDLLKKHFDEVSRDTL